MKFIKDEDSFYYNLSTLVFFIVMIIFSLYVHYSIADYVSVYSVIDYYNSTTITIPLILLDVISLSAIIPTLYIVLLRSPKYQEVIAIFLVNIIFITVFYLIGFSYFYGFEKFYIPSIEDLENFVYSAFILFKS